MPAIRSQTITIVDNAHGVFTVVTSFYGTIAYDVLRSGSGAGTVITMTVKVNGAQVRQEALPAPTTATVEDWVSADFNTRAEASVQFKIHFFSFNPLSVSIGTFNAGEVISSTWWQQPGT